MIIVVHGGAATVESHFVDIKINGIKSAVRSGYDALISGRSAVDAVQCAVNSMENDPVFNAGYGSSLTSTGDVEMDAIIMDGKTLKCGAIGGVTQIANPVSLARAVMERTDHCLLISSGAEQFAREIGIDLVPNSSLIHKWAQGRLEKYQTFANAINLDKHKPNSNETVIPNGVSVIKQTKCAQQQNDHDTVGAVAIDMYGNVAVATSTGGITGKKVGRVGDTPIIGAGGWADNSSGAVSTTGHGEAIMRVCLSREIMHQFSSSNDACRQKSLQEATDDALDMMRNRVDGYGGAIAVSFDQQIGIAFTTEMMPWAYIDSIASELIHYGIRSGEHFTADRDY